MKHANYFTERYKLVDTYPSCTKEKYYIVKNLESNLS